jgi:hypothetical protein
MIPKMSNDLAQLSSSKQSCQSGLKEERQLNQAKYDSEHSLKAGLKIKLSYLQMIKINDWMLGSKSSEINENGWR